MKTFVAVIVTSLLFAAATVGATEKPAAKTRPFRGTIKTINKAAQTIVLKGEKAQTFKIVAETKVNRDGKPVGFEDIAVGDTLGGFARQAPDGHWDALKLNLGPRAAKPPEAAGSPTPGPKPVPNKPKTK